MAKLDIPEEFGRLLSRFDELRALASSISSPNPEDDDLIKLAIVGFSFSRPTESWSRPHLEYVRRLLAGDYSVDSVAWWESAADRVRQFAALAFGYLLGQSEAAQLSGDQIKMALAVLPGFIAANSRQFA